MNIKKITGTVLAAVMLSGSTIAVAKVKAAKAASKLQTNQQWVYDTNASDPTDPQNYTQYTGEGGLSELCEQVTGICGINAPMDPSSPPTARKPLIDEDLQQRIEEENTTANDVFLLPHAD